MKLRPDELAAWRERTLAVPRWEAIRYNRADDDDETRYANALGYAHAGDYGYAERGLQPFLALHEVLAWTDSLPARTDSCRRSYTDWNCDGSCER